MDACYADEAQAAEGESKVPAQTTLLVILKSDVHIRQASELRELHPIAEVERY